MSLELLADFISRPRQAARTSLERRPISLGWASILVGSFSLFLSQSLSGRGLPPALGAIWCLLVCAISAVSAFLLTAILHLLADFWSSPESRPRPGAASALFVLMGLSELPWAAAIPLALILKALRLESAFPSFLIFACLGYLSLRLKSRSLQDVYGVGTAKAWTLLLFPYVSSLLIAVLVAAAVLVGTAVSVFRVF